MLGPHTKCYIWIRMLLGSLGSGRGRIRPCSWLLLPPTMHALRAPSLIILHSLEILHTLSNSPLNLNEIDKFHILLTFPHTQFLPALHQDSSHHHFQQRIVMNMFSHWTVWTAGHPPGPGQSLLDVLRQLLLLPRRDDPVHHHLISALVSTS